MKKLLIIFAASILGMVACNEEVETNNANLLAIQSNLNTFSFNLPLSTIDYSNITNYNGRLKFNNHQDVINTIQDLEIQNDLWNDAFNNYYENLPDEQLDSVEDAINFSDELPAEIFETMLNFTSLRSLIEEDILVWLEDDILNEENDPDIHFILDDEYRTILNPNAEVIVGDTVFKLYSHGYLKIYDQEGNLSNAINITDEIESGNIDPFDDGQTSIAIGTVVVIAVIGVAAIIAWSNGNLTSGNISSGIGNQPNTPLTCDIKTLRRKSDFERDGDRRIKWILKISNYPWGNNAVAKIRGYKKRKNNGWKKYRSELTVRCHGNMRDTSCTAHPFDTQRPTKKRRKRKAVGVVSGLATADKGDVKGMFVGAGGIQTTQELDW